MSTYKLGWDQLFICVRLIVAGFLQLALRFIIIHLIMCVVLYICTQLRQYATLVTLRSSKIILVYSIRDQKTIPKYQSVASYLAALVQKNLPWFISFKYAK